MENNLDRMNKTVPILHAPPSGVRLIEPLSVNETGSSDIYIGENSKGDKIVFDIAKGPYFVKYVRAKHEYLNRSMPAHKKNIFNIFSNKTLERVQDFQLTKDVSDYSNSSQYSEYTVTTRFVRLDMNSTSDEMLNNGQIAEEFVDGLQLESPDLPSEVKRLSILSYLDFLIMLKDRGVQTLDVNIESDLIINLNDVDKKIIVVRIDTSPWQSSEQLATEMLDISISNILSTERTNSKSIHQLRQLV